MSKNKTPRSAQGASQSDATLSERADRLLAHMNLYPGRKHALKTLAAACESNTHEGRRLVKEALDELIARGSVGLTDTGRYILPGTHEPVREGIVDLLPSGDLYVAVEGMDEDVYVPARRAGRALGGDRVEVAIVKRRRNDRCEGRITRILARSDRKYPGVIVDEGRRAYVQPDSRKMPYPIYIDAPTERYAPDTKAVVEVTRWDEGMKYPAGRITGILGPAGNNDTEMHAILAEYDLPYRFEPEVEAAAEAIPGTITEADYASRRDMRDVTTFTIDPADAKDFDDALSIRSLGPGRWEVGVHIADVTHYVREGTPVESEAVSRATSVYLVDRTVPMLPERLSNELCSLRPGEEKLTYSAIFTLDDEAQVLDQWLGRTVIRSDRRFTYDEAQQVIETGTGDFAAEITTLNRLAQLLRADRFRKGAISFEREEAKFTLDADGKPTGVYFKVMKESNQLIEEFMLLANRKVAEFIGRKRGRGANAERTFVYRVHDKPDTDRLARFSQFILRFGYTFKLENPKNISKQMNRLMDKIRGRSEENLISTLAVRTMAKAYYSTDNIGHYGLAFPYYTHFTSPIRRYPDMMVHRLLTRYLAGGKSADKVTFEQLCAHSSDMEVRAAEAERASIKYKMVEYMTDRIDQPFDGAISGVTEWGLYVELDETHIEGMVALREMGDDFYVFDEENYSIVGRCTGRRFTLGDRVRIRVKRADLQRKQLDFTLEGSIDFKTGRLVPLPRPARSEYPVEPVRRNRHRK